MQSLLLFILIVIFSLLINVVIIVNVNTLLSIWPFIYYLFKDFLL